MWKALRAVRPTHAKVDAFRHDRERQSDADFLRDCGLEPGTEAGRVALAVRRAVAGIGLVDPFFVRADDSFPGTLEVLPIWDSMDWLTWCLELDRELGRKSGFLPHLRYDPKHPITVRWLAGRVYEHLTRPPDP